MIHALNSIILIIDLTTDDNTNNNIKKLSFCYIEKLALMKHKSCAFQRQKSEHNKNRMIGLNLDDDYECIKLLHCLVKENKAEDVKDTRRLNVLMMKLLQHLDVHSYEGTWVYPNLLRGIKSKYQRKHEDENNSKAKEKNMTIPILILQIIRLSAINGQIIQALC